MKTLPPHHFTSHLNLFHPLQRHSQHVNPKRRSVPHSFNKAGESDVKKAHRKAREPFPLFVPLSAHTGTPSKYLQGSRVSFERDGLPPIVTSAHSCSTVHIFVLILDAASKLTQPFTASQIPRAAPRHMLISQRLCTFVSRFPFRVGTLSRPP